MFLFVCLFVRKVFLPWFDFSTFDIWKCTFNKLKNKTKKNTEWRRALCMYGLGSVSLDTFAYIVRVLKWRRGKNVGRRHSRITFSNAQHLDANHEHNFIFVLFTNIGAVLLRYFFLFNLSRHSFTFDGDASNMNVIVVFSFDEILITIVFSLQFSKTSIILIMIGNVLRDKKNSSCVQTHTNTVVLYCLKSKVNNGSRKKHFLMLLYKN